MFKKGIKIANTSALKGNESKKIISQICDSLSIDPIQFDHSILSSKEKLLKIKLQGTHTIIYQETKEKGKENGEPLFFDVDGLGDFYPTIYTLWRLPSLLRTVNTPQQVLLYIEGGADLMLPGVSSIENVGGLKKGDKKSVVLDGKGKAAVAVVSSLVDKNYLDSNGMKGKGFKSIHYLGDSLWELGSKSLPPMIDDNTTSESKKEEMGTTEPHSNETDELASSLSSQSLLSQKFGQDELIEYCFRFTLKNYFKGEHLKELPILYNIFWGIMAQIPCRPLKSTSLDVKKSKWKKLSAFLGEQAKEGVIQIEEKMEGVFQIIAINKSHPSLIEFKGDSFSDEELSENASILAEREGETVNEKIEIIEMFKAPSLLFPLFQEQDKRKEDLYDASQVREAISNYIATHNLTLEKSKQNITLDPLLAGIVLKKGENKETFSKKDLNEIWFSKMTPHYILKIGDNNSEVRKGSPGPINITLEDRQQRKHVTHVAGLESFGINPSYVSSEFNKLFAASTTVQQLPGKTAGKEVLIQGDFVKEIANYIVEKYQISKKYLQASHKGKKINLN